MKTLLLTILQFAIILIANSEVIFTNIPINTKKQFLYYQGRSEHDYFHKFTLFWKTNGDLIKPFTDYKSYFIRENIKEDIFEVKNQLDLNTIVFSPNKKMLHKKIYVAFTNVVPICDTDIKIVFYLKFFDDLKIAKTFYENLTIYSYKAIVNPGSESISEATEISISSIGTVNINSSNISFKDLLTGNDIGNC